MKTEVTITVTIQHDNDEDYSDILEEIDEAISQVGVEDVHIGIGEEL